MKEAMGLLKEFGADCIKLIRRDDNDNPVEGLFLVDNPELVKRLMAVCEEYDNEEGEDSDNG